jgi:hypothetical protein
MNRIARIIRKCFLVSLLVSLPTDAEEPTSENDYGRTHLNGMRGDIEWEPLLHGDGLDGWRRGCLVTPRRHDCREFRTEPPHEPFSG